MVTLRCQTGFIFQMCTSSDAKFPAGGLAQSPYGHWLAVMVLGIPSSKVEFLKEKLLNESLDRTSKETTHPITIQSHRPKLFSNPIQLRLTRVRGPYVDTIKVTTMTPTNKNDFKIIMS